MQFTVLNKYLLLTPMLVTGLAYASVKQTYEEAFASSIVLSDSDAVRFGFGNFDPISIFEPFDYDKEQSLDLRKRLEVFVLPYTFERSEDARINTHFSYITRSQEFAFNDLSLPDTSYDQLFNFYSGYETKLYQFDDWLLEGSLGVHLMHYDNLHDYNGPESLARKPMVEGIIYNTQANSLISEVDLTFSRKKERKWGHWLVKSNYNYFFGKGFGGDNITRDATPSGWYFDNSISANIKLDQTLKHTESIYLKLQRVDLGGDAHYAFNTGHYYEYGGGLLIDTRPWTSWFDNIGIGLHYNEGSVLSGGSIVIYFNEE